MSDIAPLGRPAAAGYAHTGGSSRTQNPAPATGGGRGRDRVELSRSAQLLSKLNELPEVRQGLIDRVRSEIDSETYETPQRLDAAVEALVWDLRDD